jgi:hypothetical protein
MTIKKKVLIGFGVVIVGIIVLGIVYVDRIIEGTINRELNYQIELHKNEYLIEVGEIKSTFILKRLVIKDVIIKEIKGVEEHPIQNFEFTLDKLVLKLHDFSSMFSEGELWVKEILINEPDLILNLALNEFKKKRKKKSKAGSKLFKKIRIDNININNGSIVLNQLDSNGLTSIANIEKFDLNVISSNLSFDSTNTGRKYNYKEFEFELSGIDIHKFKDHFLKIESINYNSINENFIVKNILFENDKSLNIFKQTAQFNSPWINLNINEVEFIIPVNQVFNKNIHVDLLQIGPVNFDFYQDNTLPAVTRKKIKFSYAALLSKIDFPLTIDTIRFLNSDANINIVDKNINKEDTFNINNANVDILFISTDTNYQKVHPQVKIDFQSFVWKDVPTNIHLKLDVDSASDRLEGNLQMKNLSYVKLKRFIEERIDINIYSGLINEFDFNFLWNQNYVQGNLNLDISDVSIDPKHFILPNKVEDVKFSMLGLKLKANFKRNIGKVGELIVDTLIIEKPFISWVKLNKKPEVIPLDTKIKTRGVLFQTYWINYFYLDKLTVIVYEKERNNSLPIIKLNSGWIRSKRIKVITNNKGIASFNPGDFSFQFNQLSFNNSTSNFFDINQVDYNKQKGQIFMSGIRYKSNGSKSDYLSRKLKDKFWAGLYVEKATANFDVGKVLKGDYRISKIKIDNPIITFINDPNDKSSAKDKENTSTQEKNQLPFKIDKIVIDNADMKYSIRTNKNTEYKVILANKINCRVSNISNDPKLLKNNPDLKFDLVGNVFGNTHLTISANIDQRKGKDKAKLRVDLTKLSLKEVGKRLKPFLHRELKGGTLNELHLVINSKNKNIDGNVSLAGLEINDMEVSDKKEKPDLLSLKINDLSVDFKKNGNDANSALILPSIVLQKPQITINRYTDNAKKPKKQLENKPLFAAYANDSKLIIDNFTINYAKFLMYVDGNTSTYSAIKNASLTASNIRLYENKEISLLPVSVQSLEFEAKSIGSVNNPDMLMSVSSIKYSLNEEKLTVNNLKVKNAKTLVELYEGEKYRKPWFDIYVPTIDAYFSLNDVVNTNPHIRVVNVSGVKFLFKFDYKLAINPKLKPLFVDMVKSSSIPYTIDKVAIDNSDVTIYMQENSPDRGGYLIFNDINGTIENISNDPKVIEKKPNTLVDVKTLLWGQGQGHVIGEISLSDPNKFFNLKGTVDTMDLSAADTLITNVFNMSIVSGRLNQAKFDIKFNDKQANGFMKFDYEDLKVTLFKGKHGVKVNTDTMSMAQTEKKEKLNSGFMMKAIVNGLIKTNNIPEKGNYVIGDAAYAREPDKPVFRYVWYSMAGGLMDTIEGGFLRSIMNIGKGDNKEKTVDKKVKKEEKKEEKKDGKTGK